MSRCTCAISAGEGPTAGLQAIRNADTASYLPAIDEITRRGGFVIRMGDADTPPLPPLAKVIDYGRSDMRSDWMDIFLLARSRFVLGSASGPIFVPPLYGVPCVLTNWWPPGMRPWHASDIYIPKLPKRAADGTYLTLSETLREPVSYCHSLRHLAKREGVTVEDNKPDIIREAVAEMLSRLDGNTGDDADVRGFAHARRPHLRKSRAFRHGQARARLSRSPSRTHRVIRYAQMRA